MCTELFYSNKVVFCEICSNIKLVSFVRLRYAVKFLLHHTCNLNNLAWYQPEIGGYAYKVLCLQGPNCMNRECRHRNLNYVDLCNLTLYESTGVF